MIHRVAWNIIDSSLTFFTEQTTTVYYWGVQNIWLTLQHSSTDRLVGCPSLWQNIYLPTPHPLPRSRQPECTRCPPHHPVPWPVTAHSAVRYTHMELLSALVWLCESPPLSPTLSILSSSFLSLTKWKISTWRMSGKRKEREKRDRGFAANIWAQAQGFPERHSQ